MIVQKTLSFNQLGEKEKKYAIEKYRNESDLYFETSVINEDMIEKIEEEDFDLEKNGLSWQLSYCQGDYVGISGKIKETKLHELIMEKLDQREKKKYKFWVIDRNYIEISQEISYHHYYRQQIDVNVDYDLDDETNLIENFSNKLHELAEEIVKNYVNSLCKDLQRQGFKQIEYYNSDEYIESLFIERDYKFNEKGQMIGSV